mmetsp:Transcript_4778/g.10204  ORF Transcript_4778/g.10204 Transcript_4778/m.10204 type:complete len:93 (+) Transcript_4778:1203-1481(+)
MAHLTRCQNRWIAAAETTAQMQNEHRREPECCSLLLAGGSASADSSGFSREQQLEVVLFRAMRPRDTVAATASSSNTASDVTGLADASAAQE